MTKAPMKVGIEGMYLDIIKAIYNKPIPNIIQIVEKLKTFPVKSGMIWVSTLSTNIIQCSLGIPS
jgi:hypothetical protein